MGKTVNWEKDFNTALEKAKKDKKFVMLDFFNPY